MTLFPESESIRCPAALTINSAGWVAFSSSNEDRSTNSHRLFFSTSLIGRRGIPSATTIEDAGVLGRTSDVPALLSRDGSEGMDGTCSGSIGNDGQNARGAPAKGIHACELLPWYSGPVSPAGIITSHLEAEDYRGY